MGYKASKMVYSVALSSISGYTYNGPNLSGHRDVGIYIEDHYFDRTDAAVTFKRVDFRTGETRYIYHGNDGTHMPWNDTAQLNYLSPGVREAVIRTIIHVARHFPIIRFDAAMTLAKNTLPGSGILNRKRRRSSVQIRNSACQSRI